MADLRISDLVTASQLKNDDYYEISQSESGTRVSYKATLLAIAVQIATMVDFTSDLNTTSKKITGAINELKQLISFMPKDVRTIIKDCKTPKSATITNGIAQFECIEANLVKGLKVTMNPIQDLHGYDYPWVGGAGKNKLPMTLAGIKSANTSGSWSGNDYTVNGVTFTINTDSDDNVIGITANNTASSTAILILAENFSAFSADVILNGCQSGGSNSTYRVDYNGGIGADMGSGVTITAGTSFTNVRIRIASGYSASNVKFYPMIRLSTVADTTFAPYSNICPISGRTGVELEQMGKNLIVDSIASCSISSSGNLVSSTYTTYIIKTKKGARYIASANGESVASYWGEFSTAPAMGSQSISASRYSGNSLTATIDGYIAVAFPSGSTNPMIELGQTITTYEAPITPITYTHTYASTVWWATDDFASGEMDSCGAEIASYNGETLPGGWMSDRDEYAPGTTPTIGAQVVYKNTPTTISTSAENITTVSGTNIISGTEPISECKYTELATVDDLRKIIGGQ